MRIYCNTCGTRVGGVVIGRDPCPGCGSFDIEQELSKENSASKDSARRHTKHGGPVNGNALGTINFENASGLHIGGGKVPSLREAGQMRNW